MPPTDAMGIQGQGICPPGAGEDAGRFIDISP
jgi:hypothetical protein